MIESTNDIFRRDHCKTPEWIADLEFFSLCFPQIVFTKSSGYQFSVHKFSLKAVSSRVINPLLTKLARDRTASAYGPRSFLYGPRCARSVLSRPRADILPLRPSRLVNKIYIIPPFLGSFCAAILSLLFSPYFCPVLQFNNVAYYMAGPASGQDEANPVF